MFEWITWRFRYVKMVSKPGLPISWKLNMFCCNIKQVDSFHKLSGIPPFSLGQCLVDAYTQEQLQSPGQFAEFLDRFGETKERVLKET